MVETSLIFVIIVVLIMNYLGNKSKVFEIVDMDAHVMTQITQVFVGIFYLRIAGAK